MVVVRRYIQNARAVLILQAYTCSCVSCGPGCQQLAGLGASCVGQLSDPIVMTW
jgi:hypothetical protein